MTATFLWLRREFKMDITCVQLVPFEIGDDLVLGSSVLIPLPESADYEVKVAEKHAASKRKTKVWISRRPRSSSLRSLVVAGLPTAT